MFKRLAVVGIFLFALPTTAPATAESLLERYSFPLLRGPSNALVPSEAASTVGQPESATRPATKTWWIPYFEVDRTKDGATTLFSVRNEGTNPVEVVVRFYRTNFSEQLGFGAVIAPHAVLTRNVRDYPGLHVSPDGAARGFIIISPSGPVSVDYFQVDTDQNFAHGNLGLVIDDFCANWMVRFVRFGNEEGSRFQIYLGSALGIAGPPSVAGDIYDEEGTFLSSFTIQTDQSVLDFTLSDIAVGLPYFGSIEIRLFSLGGGVVNASHSAFGRFSVGLPGVCRDGAL